MKLKRIQTGDIYAIYDVLDANHALITQTKYISPTFQQGPAGTPAGLRPSMSLYALFGSKRPSLREMRSVLPCVLFIFGVFIF